MKPAILRWVIATCFLFCSNLVFAEARFLLEGGLHVGGDDLVTVTFSDGSTGDINAGELFTLGAGVSVDMGDAFELRFVYNYKADSLNASNGSIDYSRWVSNLTLMYKIDGWRIGGGLTHHRNIKLDGDGVASSIDVRFDNSTGYMLEVDYIWPSGLYVGGQYADIDYTQTGTSNKVDAGSIGVVVGFQF